MEYDELIGNIVNEVTRRLENSKKKALVIFTGGNISLDEVIRQINRLIEDKWSLKFFLSRNAEKVITPKLIKEKLKINHLYLESDIEDEKTLLEDVEYLIIPILSMNSAAKIALGIADTVVSHLTASAIMKGISIVAVKDACDPNNPLRASKGYNKIPPAYEKRIMGYLNNLIEYNIKLVESGSLYDCVTGLKTENRQAGLQVSKKLVSREDIINAKHNGVKTICICKNTIVTMLAMDTARELGVEVECI